MQQGDDPPFLQVGTEVSAKYKGAFCEAKVRKVVRNIKCKVTFKQGLGSLTVTDEQIKGILRVGGIVEARHPDRREYVEATITKIQDCSQYTVVFDDGDITTLRRSALCLKSGRHFNESETLDQLPLTHPEHFGNPVIGGRRGRRSRQLVDDSSDDDADSLSTKDGISTEKEEHIGKVVCVETSETKKRSPKETWFPGLVVAPTAQDTVRIRVRDEYLVRSFKDGRYYTVPKKEATEFTRELAARQDGPAVIAALQYLDHDELPTHWDREALFGLSASSNSDSEEGGDSESSDDEPIEQKDHFVAQLYKFMDDRGTPLNRGPTIANRDVDLYRLYRAVEKLGGYSRVTSQNQWRAISTRLGFSPVTTSITNLVKQAYKKFLHSFEEFYRKLGCTLIASTPRGARIGKGRSLIRQRDTPTPRVSTPASTVTTATTSTSTSAATNLANDGNDNAVTQDKNSPNISSDLSTSPSEVKSFTGIPSIDKLHKNGKPNIKIVKEIAEVIESSILLDKITSSPQPLKTVKESDIIVDIIADNDESLGGDSVSVMCDSSSDIEVPVPKPTSSSTTKSTIKPKAKDKESAKNKPSESKNDDKKVKVKRKTAGRPRLSEKIVEDKTSDSDDKDRKEKSEPEIQNTRSRSKDEGRTKHETATPDRKTQKNEMREKTKKIEQETEKRRGRKRRDTDPTDKTESSEASESTSHVTSSNPKVAPPSVGDKLKVYYHESKVTYEAKVIEAEGGMYLVHYTGWNTRYDEWVNIDRIAENLSAGTKAKRLKAAISGKTTSSKRGRGGANLTLRPPSTSTDSTSSTGGPPGHTTPTHMTSSTATASQSKTETITASSASVQSSSSPNVSSRTRSPALTPARRVTRQQEGNTTVGANNITSSSDVKNRTRGRRRASTHTDVSLQSGSESEDTSSDTETELKVLPKRAASTRTYGADDKSKRKIPTVASSNVGTSTDGGLLLSSKKPDDNEATTKKVIIKKNIKKESDDDTAHKAGRDFDLNQIRSELKGFKEVVKAPVTGDDIKPDIGVLDEKTGVIDVCLSLDTPSEDIEIKLDDIIKAEMTPEKFSPSADIYEFKEPEPFEFESRKPSSEEKKKRGVIRLFEEMPELKVDKSPKKRIPVKLANRDILESSPSPTKRGKKTKKTVTSPVQEVKEEIVKSDEEAPAPKLTPQKSVQEDSFSRLTVPSFNATVQESTLPVLDDQFGIFADLGTADECVERIIAGNGSSGNDSDRMFIIRQDDSINLDDKTKKKSITTSFSPTLNQNPFLKLEDSTKIKTDSSSDDDNINAAIKRVISQTLTDDSQSSDNTTLKPETSSIFQSTFDKKLISTDPQKPLPIEASVLSTSVDMDIDTESLTIIVDNSLKEKSSSESIFDRTKQMSELKNVHSMANKVLKAMTEGISPVKNEPENIENRISLAPKSNDVKNDIKALKNIIPFELGKKEIIKGPVKVESKIVEEKVIQKPVVEPPSVMPVKEDELKITPGPVTKSNVSVSQLIQKLENSMQHAVVPPLGSTYPEDSDDSTDSEQRLVIDKLSDDEETSQQSEGTPYETPESKTSKTTTTTTTETETTPSSIISTTTDSKSDVKTSSDYSSPIVNAQSVHDKIKPDISKIEEPTVKEKSEESESNISLLLCEETIPGSPAPALSSSEVESQTGAESPKPKPKSAKNLQMELPFASAVSIGGKSSNSTMSTNNSTISTSTAGNGNSNMSFKVMPGMGVTPISSTNNNAPGKETGFVHPGQHLMEHKSGTTSGNDRSPPSTSESGTLSDVSPRDDRIASPPTLRKPSRTISSTESDMGAPDIMSPGDATAMTPGRGEISTPEEESRPVPGTAQNVNSKKQQHQHDNAGTADIENVSPKKRRRSRKASECEPPSSSVNNSGILQPPANKRSKRGVRTTSDSDNNSSDQFAPRQMKYNFCVHLDSSLDSNQRIGVLLQKLTELRKTYNNVKSELACIDRRRKKIRRREREVIKAAKAEV